MLVTEDNYAETIYHFQRQPDIVADLETTGLRPFNGDRLCGIALEAGGLAAYFQYRHLEGPNLPEGLMWPVLTVLTGAHVTGHNWIRFDAQTVAQESPDLAESMIYSDDVPMRDTIIDAYLHDETEPSYKLEVLAERYKMMPGDPAAAEVALLEELERRGYKGKQAKGNIWKLPAEVVEPYACNDVIQGRGLKKFYSIMQAAQGTTDLAGEFYRYARVIARMERVGLKVDADRLYAKMLDTESRAEAYLQEIRQAAGYEINPKSPKQLGNWLDMESTAEAALLASGSPHAELLLRYRKAKKAVGTYHKPILTLMDEGWILHPQYNLTRDPRDQGGTLSGRLSCSNPNFQALPGVEKDVDDLYGVRQCIVPRSPDRVFLAYDLERAEVWVGGSLCGEPAIHKAYFKGIDLYDILAHELRITRKAAKTLFLGLQYGMGAALLAQKLGCSESEAFALRNRFHELYPSIRRKMWELRDEAEQMGYVKLWTGRRIHFDGKRTKPFHAWNRCVQGGVAEILRRAMCMMEGELQRLDAEQVLQVHDELIVECPTKAAAEVDVVVRACLETPHGFSLPPRTAPRHGFSLGTLQEGLP